MAKANYILSAFADEASASFPEQLEALREAGIDRIEIRGVDGTNVSALTDEKAREVRRMLDGAAWAFPPSVPRFGKIVVNEGFAEHLEALKRSMEQAKILGANTFRMFSFYPPKGEDIAAYRQQVIDQLGAMLDAADAQDIVLAHENEKGIYGDIPERCLDLVETFGGRLKCIFDPANFIQCGARPADAYPMLKKHIYYFHMKDALLADGSVVPCGMGDGSVPEILKDYGGDETGLTIEPHLKVFAGLNALQGEELHHKYAYSDNRTAFRAAVDAVKSILTDAGYREGEANRWIK